MTRIVPLKYTHVQASFSVTTSIDAEAWLQRWNPRASGVSARRLQSIAACHGAHFINQTLRSVCPSSVVRRLSSPATNLSHCFSLHPS